LAVPLPDWDEEKFWFVNSDTDEHVLTKQGIHELRSAILAHKKARYELVAMWLPGLIGIIGALTGLAAVLVGKVK
jgi:hypothetical protein